MALLAVLILFSVAGCGSNVTPVAMVEDTIGEISYQVPLDWKRDENEQSINYEADKYSVTVEYNNGIPGRIKPETAKERMEKIQSNKFQSADLFYTDFKQLDDVSIAGRRAVHYTYSFPYTYSGSNTATLYYDEYGFDCPQGTVRFSICHYDEGFSSEDMIASTKDIVSKILDSVKIKDT